MWESSLEDGALVVLLVFIVATVVVAAGKLLAGSRRGGRRHRGARRRWLDEQYGFAPRQAAPGPGPAPDAPDVGAQLKAVSAATFERRQVMNGAEYRVFRIIEVDVAAARKGYRVFAQTALGQILKSPCPIAFRAINAKRSDVLVFDQAGWPVLAVEYQGRGHYQGDAPARDAIKKEALRKAGVRYLEITHEHSDDQIRARVREELGWSSAAPAPAAPQHAEDEAPRASGFGRRRA